MTQEIVELEIRLEHQEAALNDFVDRRIAEGGSFDDD